MKITANKQLLATAAMMAAFATSSNAVPVLATGANYKSDGISEIRLGNNSTITQTGKDAKIHWNSFDTTQGESITFIQPGKNSVVVNKVIGGLPTNYFGTLNANGKVVVQNNAGVTFAPGSQVNVGSLTATTARNFSVNPDGTYTASGFSDNAVNFNGNVTAADGGYVYALAKQINVGSTGTLTANNGSVQLQGGQKEYVVDPRGDGKITYSTGVSNDFKDGKVVAVNMNGNIVAHNGDVVIRTRAENLSTGSINLNGVVDTTTFANQTTGRAGNIALNSSGNLTNNGSLNSYSLLSNAGSIKLASQYGTVTNNGGLNAGSILKNGGDVTVRGGNGVVSNGWTYTGSSNANGGNIDMETPGKFTNTANASYNTRSLKNAGAVTIYGSKASNFGQYDTNTGRLLMHNQIDTSSVYGQKGAVNITQHNYVTGNDKNL